MGRADENPVNAKTAAVELGKPGKPWGHTRISAIKSAMGITNQRYFFLSDVRAFLRKHPNFKQADVYRPNPALPGSRQGHRPAAAGKPCEPIQTHVQ